MEEKKPSTWDNFRMWLIIVAFLLIFPPGLPLALSTDSPVIGGCIAVVFALVLGSVVWLVSLYAIENEEKRVRGETGKQPQERERKESVKDITSNFKVRRKKTGLGGG